jgi:GntR family transcriptional regulator
MSDQGPVEVSTSWLRAELGEVAPRLLRTDRIRQGTVAYVERVSGRKATSARDEIGARLATANERQLLDLGVKAAAVLMVRHVVCDENNQPLECVEAIYPPNRLTFTQDYPVSR